MDHLDRPPNVIWDVTYACPLRCVHCYSESGRRPARQLRPAELSRLADAIIALRPEAIALAGGEPLIVPGICDLAERMSRAGIPVIIYTSGWTLDAAIVDRVAGAFHQINVSVDGATAEVHDLVRGRAGSFDRALRALGLLDAVSRERVERGAAPLRFGIDCVVTRSSFDQRDDFCTRLAARFPHLSFVSFGAVVPAGLASRPGFVSTELLTEEQVDVLGSPAEARRLQALAPATVEVTTTDNFALQMRPDMVRSGRFFPAMQVEPDGAVRAMPVYEGTVGNLLTEPPDVLWRRCVARWSDPFVTETLAGVRTMAQWAEAARRIDYRFGSDEVRARIDRRPAFPVVAAAGGAR